MENIVQLDLGCVPDAGVSGPVLLQTDEATALIFNAQRRRDDGSYVDAGHAVLRFKHCRATKFGYPNDEAWFGIPRLAGQSYGTYEVIESDWISELDKLNRQRFPDTPGSEDRHFLILFHDSTFQCVARSYTVERTHELWETLWTRVYQDVLQYAAD